MKKVVFIAVLTVFGFVGMNAQENDNQNDFNEVVEMAKGGSFYLGANIGVPLSGAGDLASFNFGFDVAYLFAVIPNLEVGGLIGYSHFLGDGTYIDTVGDGTIVRDYKDASFLPIAASARYQFNDRKFFAGLDTGFAVNLSGDADSGFYIRPKFGYNLGPVALIGSFTSISGGTNYNSNSAIVSVSGFTTANVGVEFGF
ncbi:MAG: hypothetical protein PSN34_12385 [Urechidicola sp.]|nr:hypothetical protein [Urechidicola sp.]